MSCGGSILIVDHDPDAREALAQFVRGLGCRAVTAADGVSALAELLGGVPPCLVLLDLEAPRVDAGDFVQRIRRGVCGEDVCVVSLSARGGEEPAPAGVDRQLGRPFSHDVLWPLLDRCCRAAIRIEAEAPATYAEGDA